MNNLNRSLGSKITGAAFLLAAMSTVVAQGLPSQPKADLIFIHGNIYTGITTESSTRAKPRAQALAVRDGRVAAVGLDDEILQLKGPSTTVIDLAGNFVMPGFNDAHMHLVDAGFQRLNVELGGVQSLDELSDRVRKHVLTAQPGEWITGGGWDHTLWPGQKLPSRLDLDKITTAHPVFLHRVDGHIAIANSKALQLAGITAATKDPDGGQIDRDASGQPTGILRETARKAVTAVIPSPTHDQRIRAFEVALQELAESGITSAQDNSDAGNLPVSWEDFTILEEIERDGKLTARVSEWMAFNDQLSNLIAHRASHPRSDNMLHTGMLKAFMDGSLGSRTAALLEPYADEPKNFGIPQYQQDKLNRMAKERVDAGFQIGFHAIGDKGVQMALDAFAFASASPTGHDLRMRVEHAQVTTPQQVAEFKKLGMIASMQPNHLLTDMNWAESRLGPKRAASSYAWAEFLKEGVPLAFGTDYPVEPVTPFRGLYAAVTRKSEDGKREYYPEQKLSIEQAIAAYTTGSAFAEFAEREKGALAPGMLADLVVLDRDITAVAPEQIPGTKVLRTVVGGKTVYQAK